ncbi:Heteroproteinous nuclear ribonucleoprotein 1 [Turnera subulata]|uniref:Heteroproteinous nuclear ribonucleoprotein 1 n=1 Tax=Turnera subulata TaxID=218843 RepID=A0A9Q0F199_9ROSI|nr:Heteroproteinous nuclear ribonucleoprotein 1 [Turnera subulata]
MDSDEGKLFVGGIAWDTTEDTLRDHFGQYGDVSQAVIMRDKTTGRPRGFGFVVFSDPSLLDRVLQEKHTIDGRTVEAKRALSRDEQYSSSRSGNFSSGGGRGSGGGGNFKTKKIFVGGLPSSLTEDGFRQYFENYGHVTDVVVMYDQHTQRPRGFGFITFDSEDAVDEVLQKTFHELNGKLVEVKRALPKDASPGGGGGGGPRGGNYSSNAAAADGRLEGSRYMQPQNSTGGYPPYSGYGSQGYAYGAAGVGYGGYASYAVGGYGGGSAGYGGPTGAYGMPGVFKNAWGGQVPSGYGANAGYGTTAPWSAPGSGNSASAHMGQSSGAASGYRTPGYGYSTYGGSDGHYSGHYGPSGNATNGSAGNGGTAGDDTNRNSGYDNEGWGADPSQASSGYGGAYGGPHSRQAPQQ